MFKRNPDRISDRRTEGISGRRTDSASGRETAGAFGRRTGSASGRGSDSASGRSSGRIYKKTGRERLLSLVLCLVLFLAAAAEPAAVYAGSSSDASEEADDDAEPAESWRYSDGELIEYPDTDSLNAVSTLTTPSVYSTWKKSYGTSYYGIYSSSGTTKVKVGGVKRIGVDVSKWQGSIDWEKVAADGIDYAIIRCGYGSNSTDYDDPYFLENVKGALENGLEVGVYLYSYATTTTAAKSEVKHVLRLLDEAGLTPSKMELPIFYDMEDDAQTTLTVSKLGDIAETFCNGLLDEGYAVGVYASKSWWNSNLVDSRFLTSGWYKWVARYPVSSSVTESGTEDTDMWQFSSRATVSGISTRVDINFDYLGEGAYTASASSTSSTSSTSSSSSASSTTVAATVLKASLSSSLQKVTLSWSKVSGASGYRIYRSTDGGSYERIAVIEGNSTLKYTDTVEVNKAYKYKIKAYRTASDGSVTLGDSSNVKKIDTTLEAPVISNAILTTSGYSRIYWDAVEEAQGYEVYRSTDGGSTYKKVKTITSGDTLYWTDKSVSTKKEYRYKVRAYVIDKSSTDGTADKIYSSFSKVKKFSTTPSKASISAAKKLTNGTVKLTWKKQYNASGYLIYRSTDGGSYKLVKTITKRTTVSWTDTTVKAGRVYRYKVKAYTTSAGKTVKGTASAAKKATAKPAKTSISSITAKSKALKVSWKKVTGATGYTIAYRLKGSSTWHYKRVKSTSATLSSLKKGKTYYVKVRAWTSHNGTKTYAAWSSTKSKKTK